MFDAQNLSGEEENITMTAGFGFFPPLALLLATFDFTSGDNAHAPLDVVTFKQIYVSTGILVCFLIVFSILF